MIKHYPSVSSNPDFPAIERNIIAWWKQQEAFQQSLRGEEEFVFYDGPPFANGLPHYGHLLTGFIKDAFPRYQTMLGKKVGRKFGWDCHGLPAEMAAEKDLGISGRIAVEEYGIDKFNDHCRKLVLRYTSQWEDYVNRQGRWVDFANGYRTMDLNFMESVLWAFKTLYDKGLLYESKRVMPYSWACQTPVSDFETKMDNAYHSKTSKAVTLTFTLEDPTSIAPHLREVKLLAWTTTPWTLPSNLALAVGEEIEYSLCEQDGVGYIIASNLLSKYDELAEAQVVSTFFGGVLAGLRYLPPFHYFSDHHGAFRILLGDFVTTSDGTGVVHIAPGFGEDDQLLCQKHGIELVCPVDEAGKFTYPVSDLAGVQVFDTNDEIIKRLKRSGSWIRTEQYIHNYPHCWRTDTPLIYKAMPSWYLRVTAIKDRMIENNQQIEWKPDHIKEGLFGKWLSGARDWSISRNRFWGCPIPVWQSDDPQYPHTEVYGSIAEIEEAFGVAVSDLHRPFIDSLVKPNPKDPTGNSMLRRVPDVLDCWFESGSMPFAQVHYPFENKDWFEQHFPADFIVEYLSQTRGWFYTLLVLSTALFDRPPFRNCICHGVILGDDGQKLSKRLGNYVDPNIVFDQIGADAMRWYMLSSPVMRGQEMVIDRNAECIREVSRLVLKPLWNAYNFFTLYANADGIRADYSFHSTNMLDRYIISRCAQAVSQIKTAMDNFDTPSATNAASGLLEVLNNWYIRRSRDRFWKTERDEDKEGAYNTLYSVLHTACRAIAPLLPLITEEIFLGLTGSASSVHLQSFPQLDDDLVDEVLMAQMEQVRGACTAALFIRNQCGIKVRQPLASITFIGVDPWPAELILLLQDEINVKVCNYLPKREISHYADHRLQVHYPLVGKRLPSQTKHIVAAVKNNQWEQTAEGLFVAGVLLKPEEFSLQLHPKPEFSSIAPMPHHHSLVSLDLTITRPLMLEGIARDIVRCVQQLRKSAELQITDKIELSLSTSSLEVEEAVRTWQHYLEQQLLCTKILWETQSCMEQLTLDQGHSLNVKLRASDEVPQSHETLL